MSRKDVGVLIIIAFLLRQMDSASLQCKNLVKDAILHSYSTSGTICKREAKVHPDFSDSGVLITKLHKRQAEKPDEHKLLSEVIFRTIKLQEADEKRQTFLPRTLLDHEADTDLLDQLTFEELEEVYSDIVARVGRTALSRNDVEKFSARCCQNIDTCRSNPKMLISC